MKKIFSLLLLALAVNGFAQDKPIVVSGKMFDPESHGMPLVQLNGWYFRVGSDTAWVKSKASLAGWQKLNPQDLSAKYADKNGRLEGWFRIKLKFDPSVKDTGFNIHYWSYAPADIYVNGKHAGSAGSTGFYGHPYAEYHIDYLSPGIHIPVKKNEEFVLALHFTDTLAPFVPAKLKSQFSQSPDMFYLGTQSTSYHLQSDYFDAIQMEYIDLSVLLVVGILFWLFVFQNRQQRVFFYIALWAAAAALNVYCDIPLNRGSSSLTYLIYSTIQKSSATLIYILTIIIIALILNRKLTKWVKLTMIIVALYRLLTIFLPGQLSKPINVDTLFIFCLSIYLIVSSWKKLRGAQWSVVVGLLATFFCILGYDVAPLLLPQDEGLQSFLSAGLVLAFPLSLLVFVSIRFKEILHEVRLNADEVVRLFEEKKEEALNRQKFLQEEVDRQTAEIRANQARLIQSEKMASLGELTAGIAHEIQNPLNFVNNFSEVSVELLAELKEEEEKGNRDDVIAIADDLTQNLEKIRHHGQRADAIVKGMLQHSRASSGQKQPTNINALADEYLRLAYHGLRAKDNAFNANWLHISMNNCRKSKLFRRTLAGYCSTCLTMPFMLFNKRRK